MSAPVVTAAAPSPAPIDDAVAPERLARALETLAAIMERRGALVAAPVFARIEAAYARARAGDGELARIVGRRFAA